MFSFFASWICMDIYFLYFSRDFTNPSLPSEPKGRSSQVCTTTLISYNVCPFPSEILFFLSVQQPGYGDAGGMYALQASGARPGTGVFYHLMDAYILLHIFMFSRHRILISFRNYTLTTSFFLFGSSCISTGVYCSCQTMVEMIEEYNQNHSLIIRVFSFCFK